MQRYKHENSYISASYLIRYIKQSLNLFDIFILKIFMEKFV